MVGILQTVIELLGAPYIALVLRKVYFINGISSQHIGRTLFQEVIGFLPMPAMPMISALHYIWLKLVLYCICRSCN